MLHIVALQRHFPETHNITKHKTLSLSAFPFYFEGLFFTSVAVFLLHFFFIILWSRSPRILEQPQSDYEGQHFLGFLTNFLLSCVGALSSIIIGHRDLLFFKE